jgi:hypothetical protein
MLVTGVLRSGATVTDVGSGAGGSVAGTIVLTGGNVGTTSVATGAGVSAGGGVASSAETAATVHSQRIVATHRERMIMTGTRPL